MITKSFFLDINEQLWKLANQKQIDYIYNYIKPLLESYINKRDKSILKQEMEYDIDGSDSTNFFSHLIQICGSVLFFEMEYEKMYKDLFPAFLTYTINAVIADITFQHGLYEKSDYYFGSNILKILNNRLVESYNEAIQLSPQDRKLLQAELLNNYIYQKL